MSAGQATIGGVTAPLPAPLTAMPELIAGPTRLRPWRADDLTCVEQASEDVRIPRGTTVPRLFTAAAGREWIERQWSRLDNSEGWSSAIADASTDDAVGCVVLMRRPLAGVVGVGYWMVPAARRRGHATRAVGLVTAWALGDGGFSRVEAWVEPGNDASVAVLTACGFAYEGRLRSFLSFDQGRSDALVFSSVAEDREASSRP